MIDLVPGALLEYSGLSPRGMQVLMLRESGGNPMARNPRSSALGPYQFTDRTWRWFMQENPALFSGMTPEQAMSMRTDPAMSSRAAQWYASRNAQELRAANLPVNDATLALAHNFGAQGASRLLRARDDEPVELVLSASAIRANPHLRGRTAGQVRSGFAGAFNLGEGFSEQSSRQQEAPSQALSQAPNQNSNQNSNQGSNQNSASQQNEPFRFDVRPLIGLALNMLQRNSSTSSSVRRGGGFPVFGRQFNPNMFGGF